MKNLIIKTLLIPLLLSAVIPSGIQASLLGYTGNKAWGKLTVFLGRVGESSVAKVGYSTYQAHQGKIKKRPKKIATGIFDIKKVLYSIIPALEVQKPSNVRGAYKSHLSKVSPVENRLLRQLELQKNLCNAIESGNKNRAEQAIKFGADINKPYRNCNPLALAAFLGNLGMVKLLLKNRTSISDDITPLMTVAMKGDLTIAKFLLQNKADPNKQSVNGSTALMLAASRGDLEMVKLLLQNGAKVDKETNNGFTALLQATGRGHLETTRLLLANRANVNVHSKNGYTPLMSAARGGHLQVVELLLKNGADANQQDDNNRTALEWAEKKGYLRITKLLAKVTEVKKPGILSWLQKFINERILR